MQTLCKTLTKWNIVHLLEIKHSFNLPCVSDWVTPDFPKLALTGSFLPFPLVVFHSIPMEQGLFHQYVQFCRLPSCDTSTETVKGQLYLLTFKK